MIRIFDHIDLRVSNLEEAQVFYSVFLPAIGFPDLDKIPIGNAYHARRDHPKPEFIGLIEDPKHVPNSTRLAFWAETKNDVDRLGELVTSAGARNIEGPMFCPEYSPTYYALYFDDPCGNRLEVCSRSVTQNKD